MRGRCRKHGMELPWPAVRRARDQDLTSFEDLGVYEEVDEQIAIVKYGATPVAAQTKRCT